MRDGAEDAEHFVLVRALGGVEEAGDEDQIAEDEDAATMIVALRLDVGVRHQEHRKHDGDDVPARENQPEEASTNCHEYERCETNVKVSATEPIFSGA